MLQVKKKMSFLPVAALVLLGFSMGIVLSVRAVGPERQYDLIGALLVLLGGIVGAFLGLLFGVLMDFPNALTLLSFTGFVLSLFR